MKKKILLFAVLTSSLVGFSQDMGGKVKKAKKAYSVYAYADASEKYADLGSEDIELKRELANSYWRSDKLNEAEQVYSEIVALDDKTSQDLYNYSAILRQNRKYEESETWMSNFAQVQPSDSRAEDFESNKGVHLKLLTDQGQFKLKNLEVNSEQQDFGATFYKEQVVFASSREGMRAIKRRWNWNELPFLDMYVADKTNGDLTNASLFAKKENKKYHEGPVAFNKAGDMMIFTRNNYGEQALDGIVRLKMFSSKLVEGKWSKPEPLPFNSADYSCGHATISNDGKWMYFASDMPGGIGGSDIYKAKINEDGTFGEAVNMGKEVNTEGNEMFPFIHTSDQMLFFSSDGKLGLGGLDIFVAEIKEDKSLGKVINPGVPLNSNRDDFSFVLNDDQSVGYIASNREGGKGNDDIYSFEMLKPFKFGKTIFGYTKDQDGNILANVDLKLLDYEFTEISAIQSNEEGEFSFLVDDESEYHITGEKEDYFGDKEDVSTYGSEDRIEVLLELEKDPGLAIYALVTDKETSLPLDSVKITLSDNLSGEVVEFITPTTGDYLKPVLDKKIGDNGSYNLILERRGYLSKVLTYAVEFDKEGVYDVHAKLDLSMDPISLGGDLSKIIDINPIYFDLNKFNIRPDAARELDKIVKVMNENPKMVIELGSHTDSRGSESSNRLLSDKRAKSSAKYIAERITNPERIYGKGYGESIPNKLITADGEIELIESYINSFRSSNRKRFDELHQFNRRDRKSVV